MKDITLMMRSCREFRKKMAVGSVWECYDHRLDFDLGFRTCAAVNEKGYAFPTYVKPIKLSWRNYPEDKICLFNGSQVTFFDDQGQPTITMTLLLLAEATAKTVRHDAMPIVGKKAGSRNESLHLVT